jgi:hypothetical protein
MRLLLATILNTLPSKYRISPMRRTALARVHTPNA